MGEEIREIQLKIDEIPGSNPYIKPKAYFRKDNKGELRLRKGRRPSSIFLVDQLRKRVDNWRKNKYPGLSNVGRTLFTFWFKSDYALSNGISFNYYFCQREAIETFVYIIEILEAEDLKNIIEEVYPKEKPDTIDKAYEFGLIEKTTDETYDTITLYPSEKTYILSKRNLLRLAFKMATGSGKTFVMALTIVYCYFKNIIEGNKNFPINFLIVTPGLPVYERLVMDFQNREIFNEYPMIPDEWNNDWNINIILKNDNSPPSALGNIYLANIQHLTAQIEKKIHPIERIMGKKATKKTSKYSLSILDKIKASNQLMVLNDEAHRVNQQDPPLKWKETLIEIHNVIQTKNSNGLFAWLDFSATPKNRDGSFFPWIIVDYPLVQAIEDRTVKRPIVINPIDKEDPENVTQYNIIQKYEEWLNIALDRWKKNYDYYEKLGKKVVLFIMAEKIVYAKKIADHLMRINHFTEKEVLLIHTDAEGYVKDKDLSLLDVANSIDSPENDVKIIVSVLMLKEGWNVKNVNVILGLRAFGSPTLPEQVIGRGLRRMSDISPSENQYLELIGTENFRDFIFNLRNENVHIPKLTEPPKPPVYIYVIEDRIPEYDIKIPTTYPRITKINRLIGDIDISTIDIPNIDEINLDDSTIVTFQDMITKKKILEGVEIKNQEEELILQFYLINIVNQLLNQINMICNFSNVFKIVKVYILDYVFRDYKFEKAEMASYLENKEFQQKIIEILRNKINNTAVEENTLKMRNTFYKLSETNRFQWSRTDFIIKCEKTVFNYISSFNNLEKDFAEFLDNCPDILRFAKLPERNSKFFIEYINSDGGVGFYYPDFVLVQENQTNQEIHWLIETKGYEDENVSLKDAATIEWCKNISNKLGDKWKYKKIPDAEFRRLEGKVKSFERLINRIE